MGEGARLQRAAVLLDLETPGHAQVHHQGLAGVEVGQHVLGPAAQMQHPRALQSLAEMLGQGKAQIWPAGQDVGDHVAFQGGQQPPPYGLDFGQLRHDGAGA